MGGKGSVLVRKSDGSEVEAGGEEVHAHRAAAPAQMTWTFSDDPSGTQQLIRLAHFSESEGSTTVVMVNSGIAID